MREGGEEGEDAFTGTILDDCFLGEATVTGAQSGLHVRFTNVYVRPNVAVETAPVEYEGTLLEDGRHIAGT